MTSRPPATTRLGALAGVALAVWVLAVGVLVVGVLVVGVSAGSALVGAAAAAPAPRDRACLDQDISMQARQAQAVFTGEVTAAKASALPDGQRGVRIVHDVAVAEVYKAARVTVPAQVQVVTTRNARGECGLGRLDEGERVVFFVRTLPSSEDEDEDQVAVFAATGDSGTAPAASGYLTEVEEILPNPVPPVPATPTAAEFEALAVDPPTPLGRAAAPGAALVVIGLLGLFLVRRLSRR